MPEYVCCAALRCAALHCSPQWPNNSQCANTCTKTVVGGFELLCDEAAEQAKAKAKDGAASGGHSGAGAKRAGMEWR